MSTIKTDTIQPLGTTVVVNGGLTVAAAAHFSSGVTFGSDIKVSGGLTVANKAYFSSGITVGGGFDIYSGILTIDKPYSVASGGGAVTIQTNSAWTAWARGINWNFGGITAGGGIGMYGTNGTTSDYIYLSFGDQQYGNTGSGAFLTYTGKFGVGVKDPVARLQVCGASASDSHTAANSGSFMVTNLTNTRQLQMGTTAGGVWIDGWLPGVGGSTLCLQPSGGSVRIGREGAYFANPSGSSPMYAARAMCNVTTTNNGSIIASQSGVNLTAASGLTGRCDFTFTTPMTTTTYNVVVSCSTDYLSRLMFANTHSTQSGAAVSPTVNGFSIGFQTSGSLAMLPRVFSVLVFEA